MRCVQACVPWATHCGHTIGLATYHRGALVLGGTEWFPSGLAIPNGTADISACTERSKTLLLWSSHWNNADCSPRCEQKETSLVVWSADRGDGSQLFTPGLLSGCDRSLEVQVAEVGLLQLLGWVIILPSPPLIISPFKRGSKNWKACLTYC